MKPRFQRYEALSVSKAILVFSRYLNGIGFQPRVRGHLSPLKNNLPG
jgi:hypothetical protein